MRNRNLNVENRGIAKKWGIVLAVLVVLAGVGYPVYFNWWDHHNCTESGGSWNEADDKCVEPAGADIPNTSKSKVDEPG